MEKQLETYKATRKWLLALLEGLTVEELNKVPAGFNNNIVWNTAHVVAAQQGVCYKRAGLNMIIEESYFEAYKPDSKPAYFVESAEIDLIKSLLVTTIDRFETDYKKGLFNNYSVWTTRYGVELKSIEDALTFLPFHEGIHVGYIMALKRAVKA